METKDVVIDRICRKQFDLIRSDEDIIRSDSIRPIFRNLQSIRFALFLKIFIRNRFNSAESNRIIWFDFGLWNEQSILLIIKALSVKIK